MSASPVRKLLVVGGSAICCAALAKGIQVTSVSSSGRPYTTPKGHTPAWTSKVTWLKGSAHNPTTFSDVLADVHGVVHTLGTLIEDGGSVFGFQNPLKGISEGSYEDINRDSALRVCEAFLSSGQGKQSPKPRPFVYISAEDVFRPIIPARYIETKREAEMGIEAMLSTSPPGQYRGVYIRPSLVYHAHYRPLTTPAAAIFDLSASLHRKIPQGIPKPSQLLHYLGAALSPQSSLSIRNARGPLKDASLGSPLDSIANAITIPPIHVDHVAEAIVIALEDSTVRGVVGVGRMRELIGWWPEDQHRSTQNAI
ncbi:mitochondrial protein [Lentinula edodes]|uniref:Mitochondrial protein n=1 Tax=Lentinula edodes TaxID=5353 RepID=A0A1Q3ESC2_LENED|nr:mitochondrial protein [Lentinula edodes]